MAGCMILKIINKQTTKKYKEIKDLLPSCCRLQWNSEGLGIFEDGAGPYLQGCIIRRPGIA